jgi:hypothetical protein
VTNDLPLIVWAGRWTVSRLPPEAPVPEWASRASTLTVIARTAEELSIVAPEDHVPADVLGERGYRVIKIEGPISFQATGIIAAFATPLATAGIAIFPVSTYDTDYVLVRDTDLSRAIDTLRLAGWKIRHARGFSPARAALKDRPTSGRC